MRISTICIYTYSIKSTRVSRSPRTPYPDLPAPKQKGTGQGTAGRTAELLNIDTSSEDKGSSAVEPSDAPGTTGNAPSEAGSAQGVKQPAPMTAGNPAQDQVPGNPTQDQVPGNPTQSVAPPSEHPARRHNDITPLSAKRYKVTFTASEEVVGKFQQARALLSHVVVGNDLEGVIERALTVLIKTEEKRRFGTLNELHYNTLKLKYFGS